MIKLRSTLSGLLVTLSTLPRRIQRVGIVAILLSFGCVTFQEWQIRRMQGEILHARQQQTAILAAHLEAILHSAQQVALTTAILAAPVRQDPRQVDSLLRRLVNSAPSKQILGIGVGYEPFEFGPSRKWVGSYQSRITPTPSGLPEAESLLKGFYAETDWYQSTKKTQGSTIRSLSGGGLLQVTQPLQSENRPVIGVATVEIQLSQVPELFSEFTQIPSAIIIANFPSGSTIVYPQDLALVEYSENLGVKPLLPGDALKTVLEKIRTLSLNRNWILFKAPVGDTGITIEVAALKSDYFQSIIVLRFPFIGILLTLGAGIVVVVFLHRQLDHQLVQNNQLLNDKSQLQKELTALAEVENSLRLQRTQLREQAQQLEHDAQHDALHDELTGLPNRSLFMDRLQQTMARMQQTDNYRFAVLFLDLDRFKVINDSLGHLVGDKLLIEISTRLNSCLRDLDTVARVGGDEFVILLDYLKTEKEALELISSLQTCLKQPLFLEDKEVFVTASMGVVLSNPIYHIPEEIIRDADIAMYRAKERGKNCYEIFNPEMHSQAVLLMQLEIDLRKAVDGLFSSERPEFELYFQPIVSLQTHRIVGFESLIRWNHPERGMISPLRFIPMAEETGLILTINHWVLQQSCQQLMLWRQHFPSQRPLSISVNVSSQHFAQSDLITSLDQLLLKTKLDPSSLKLEITESVFMSGADAVIRNLKRLKRRKIQLCIDDFGTGYSSLSYLDRFPIDTLKIDRSFLNRIGKNGENTYTVRAIIALARSMNLEVVAEGVETLDQLIQLKMLHCEYAQGYFYSKPLDVKTATALLEKDSVSPLGDRKLIDDV